jgi:hypothetical protein
MLLGCSGNTTIYPVDELCRAIQIDSTIVADIVANAAKRTEEIKLAMLSRSPAPGWCCYRDQAAGQLGNVLRPLYVGDPCEIDAFRILCGTLAGQPGPEAPNLAVVYLRRGADIAALLAALEQAEAQAGVAKLPLLILSEIAPTGIDPAPVRDRRYRAVQTPLSVSNFISSVNELSGPNV